MFIFSKMLCEGAKWKLKASTTVQHSAQEGASSASRIVSGLVSLAPVPGEQPQEWDSAPATLLQVLPVGGQLYTLWLQSWGAEHQDTMSPLVLTGQALSLIIYGLVPKTLVLPFPGPHWDNFLIGFVFRSSFRFTAKLMGGVQRFPICHLPPPSSTCPTRGYICYNSEPIPPHVIVTQSSWFTLGVGHSVSLDRSVLTHTCQRSIIQSSSTALKILCANSSCLHWSVHCFHIFSNILLIMLLQLSHFFSLLYSPLPCTTPPTSVPPPYFMSMGHTYKFFGFYISHTILNLLLVYFVPTIYASHSLYLFPHSPPSFSPPIILCVISTSVILFLFQLFA